MSRGGTRTRPTGTLERSEVDPRLAAQEAAEQEVARRCERAARFVYATFGVTVEPYVGFESFAGQYSPWRRIAVELPGLPVLNYGEYKDGRYLAFVQQCLVCDAGIFATFEDALELAAILEAPLHRCSRCEKRGTAPLVNVLGEEG